MNKTKYMLAALLLALTLNVSAEPLKGKVMSADGNVLSGAVLTSPGAQGAVTAQDGTFQMDVASDAVLNVWADGYYAQEVAVNGRGELTVVMISRQTYKYAGKGTVERVDFSPGAESLEQAIQGELPGLQVTQKSGMPGEGAAMLMHGLRTLAADAMPLVVINGVPYLPSTDESQLIGGYSKSIFQAYNVQDIVSVRLLTGAEASTYGSLAANGVLLVETDVASSDDMDTEISYSGSFGYRWNNRQLPLMNASLYKSYISDLGMTYYDNMETFFTNFPFLSPDESDAYNYLYDFDTDWQQELYQRGMTTDHLIRVDGGDAIAKYDISIGYTHEDGTLKNTSSDRFTAQINSDVVVSKKFEVITSLGLAYLTADLQEQGMSAETNPLLAAYRRAPVLSPYKSDMYGNLLDTYSSYYFGNNTNTDFIVSNPTAIINTLSSDKRQYDAHLQADLRYQPTRDLAFDAMIGLYYNYDQEGIFVPGLNNSDIVPQFDSYGESQNIVRQGINNTFDMFYGLNGRWHHIYGSHDVSLSAGARWITTSFETDMGVGRNTPNDFFQTLSDVQKVGRYFSGYGSKWNWMDVYGSLSYTWNRWLNASVYASADGASSTGVDAPRMGFFPAVSAKAMLHELPALSSLSWLDRLTLKADYGLTGNSRFSGNYGSYYYVSQLYQGISGIVRQNVPNTSIKWEQTARTNLGAEAELLRHRVGLQLGWFNEQATDVLVAGTTSSLYGTGVHYSNDASILSRGIDASLRLAPVYGPSFKWVLGGNLTQLHNEVLSLGADQQLVSALSDGAELITRVGGNPYAFYGYQTDAASPVFATTLEAQTAYTDPQTGETRPVRNRNGVDFEAGDVRYVDQNNDGIINDQDKVVLGSATPDMYGSLFNRFQYKGLALDLNFVWSVGNEAYNAVRRITESSDDFSNQSLAVTRRWTMDGQQTDMPRANYNDLVGNNDFSDRWIENASYLKLRDITLSYTFDRPVLSFFQGGSIYVSGQNLWCLTSYLGSDPEFSYSYSAAMQGVDYAKVALPKSLKMGVNLKF